MSNLLINIRFWCIHLQVSKEKIPKLCYNPIHLKCNKLFAVYKFFDYV